MKNFKTFLMEMKASPNNVKKGQTVKISKEHSIHPGASATIVDVTNKKNGMVSVDLGDGKKPLDVFIDDLNITK